MEQELREQNPTLPELREKADKTREDVETYAAKADYAEAGRLQVMALAVMMVEGGVRARGWAEGRGERDDQEGGSCCVMELVTSRPSDA